MKAHEARKVADASLIPNMEEIYEKIEKSARQGDFSVSICCSKLNHRHIPKIKEKLESDGYSVKRDSYSDQRDSWDNLNISWDGAMSPYRD